MIKYIHTFRVSSGKGKRQITKVYDDFGKAWREYSLLGGELHQMSRDRTWEGKR